LNKYKIIIQNVIKYVLKRTEEGKEMSKSVDSTKKAEITMRMSEFEMPPMQDVLIVGRRAPIGPEAARRMVDILSPDQYEIVKVDHPAIEAMVVRKALFNMLPQEKLVALLMEEGERVANESTIVKAQVSIVLQVSKAIDL
jgi:hypothetical protein